MVDLRLGRRVGVELVRVVFVVDIVANAHKLAAVVRARQQNDRHAQNLGIGDALDIWRVGLENKLVDADGDGADKQRVELLVVLVAGGRADVRQLPLEVWR